MRARRAKRTGRGQGKPRQAVRTKKADDKRAAGEGTRKVAHETPFSKQQRSHPLPTRPAAVREGGGGLLSYFVPVCLTFLASAFFSRSASAAWMVSSV